MASKGLIYVMDMESTLSEALARRVLEMDQYFMFRRWDMKIDPVAEIEGLKDELKGIIISGSAKNVNRKKSPPTVPAEFFQTQVPILAICYGMQYIAHLQGKRIVRCWNEQDPAKRTKEARKKDVGEQGPTKIYLTEKGTKSILFRGLGPTFPVWMKHNWMIEELPEGWDHLAVTGRCPIAAMEKEHVYAVQFHPEPYHSLFGKTVLHNFLTLACGVQTPYF